MEKITVRGLGFVIPQDLCVSCCRPPSPGRFIILKVRYRYFRRDLPFPACDHCAVLYERAWRRALIIMWAMIIVLFTGLAFAPLLAAEVIVPLFVPLPDQGWQASEDLFREVLRVATIVASVAAVAGVLLGGKIAGRLAIRSLGDADPPLKIAGLTTRYLRYGSDPEKLDWTFRFENEIYALRFRSLNGSIVKEPG